MNVPQKSLAALVVVVLVAGTALSLSGRLFSGDFGPPPPPGGAGTPVSGTSEPGYIPPWCIKNPVSDSGSSESGSYGPPKTTGQSGVPLRGYSWQMDKPGSRLPGFARKPDFTSQYQNPLKDIISKKFKDLDKPLVTDDSSTSTSDNRRGGSQGTVRKGQPGTTIPGVTIPGLPGGTTPPDDSSTSKPKNGDPYFAYKIICPDGYHPDYDLFDTTCPRIKQVLESGKFTEATLPDDMKKLLPQCKRWGSWFSLPKMSDSDCDALFLDQMLGKDVDQSKWDYCVKMKPVGQYGKNYDKYHDMCVDAKKNGTLLSAKMQEFCEKNMWWWKIKNPPSNNDCKKISSTMSDYKKAGGEYCDLPMSDTSQYCSEFYPKTMPADYVPCGKGGGGDG